MAPLTPALSHPTIMAANTWFFLDSGLGRPAENMAWDEALLEFAPQLDSPVLRFYGWTEPAATFGYFQHFADLERATPLRPLIRRTTGGGLVPHEADWTYSLVFPPSHPWYAVAAAESYLRLHEWIQTALQECALTTELAPSPRKEIPGQCFAGYEQSDLLCRGRKIAGAAQRRSRQGLLIQGSIQPRPPGLERTVWQTAMLRVATTNWGVSWETLPVSEALAESARQLAETKYGLDSFNRRR